MTHDPIKKSVHRQCVCIHSYNAHRGLYLLPFFDQVSDHREVVAVAIDEGVSLKGTVWSPLTAALLSDEEGAIEDLHPPKAQRLPRVV